MTQIIVETITCRYSFLKLTGVIVIAAGALLPKTTKIMVSHQVERL